jgi:hypothetical protein
MNNKTYIKTLSRVTNEAFERYPDDSILHRDMRRTFIKRMMILEQYAHTERNKFFFQLAQLVLIVLMILAIILL